MDGTRGLCRWRVENDSVDIKTRVDSMLQEESGPQNVNVTLQAYGSPSDALGEAEVQAAGTQREADAGMATRGPATVSRSVRALGAAIHDLRTGRHEPDEPRGSRPDLWGAAGEIPPGYSAAGVRDTPY